MALNKLDSNSHSNRIINK